MAEYNLLETTPSTLAVGDVLYVNGNGRNTTKANIQLPRGRYILAVQGAGTANEQYNTDVVMGGSSLGILELSDNTRMFLVAGGTGQFTSSSSGGATAAGGFNGGGSSKVYGSTQYFRGGAGASDIRIGTDSLYARVIVAGGAGGMHYEPHITQYGAGGGTSGGDGRYSTSASLNYAGGGGGTQITGGAGGGTAGDGANTGRFLYGGGISGSYTGAGGGGGWYGGGATKMNYSYGGRGGGGSGWVYTAETYANWLSGNSTDANQYLLTPDYYLTDASTTQGGSTTTEGRAQITILELGKTSTDILYVNTNAGWQKMGGR